MRTSASTRAAALMETLFPEGAHSFTFQQAAIELAIQQAEADALEAAAQLADLSCRMPMDPNHPMTFSDGPALPGQIRALKPQVDR